MIVQKESKYNNVLQLLDPLQDQSKTYKDVIQQYIKRILDLKLETYLNFKVYKWDDKVEKVDQNP